MVFRPQWGGGSDLMAQGVPHSTDVSREQNKGQNQIGVQVLQCTGMPLLADSVCHMTAIAPTMGASR